MGLLLNFIYQYIYLYTFMPMFLIILYGRPKFVINAIHRVLNIRDPISKIKVFRFILLFNTCYILYCIYYARVLRKTVAEYVVKEVDTLQGVSLIGYLDDKIREQNLCERNAYMFFTLNILILVFEKLCFTYFKMWKSETEFNKLHEFKESAPEDSSRINEYINKHIEPEVTYTPTPGGETPGECTFYKTIENRNKYPDMREEINFRDTTRYH
jgi:hypothetical protein